MNRQEVRERIHGAELLTAFNLREIEARINMAALVLRYFDGALDNGRATDMSAAEIEYLVRVAKDLIDVGHEDAMAWCDRFALRLRIRWIHASRRFILEATV